MEYKIDPQQWFLDRQLAFKPSHFFKTNTVITKESLNWVVYTLKGRFALYEKYDDSEMQVTATNSFTFLANSYIAFEDPNEAVLFELRWS